MEGVAKLGLLPPSHLLLGRPVTSSTPQPAQEGPSYLYRREFPIPPKGTAAHLAQVGVLGLLPLAPDDLVTTLGALPYLQLATGVTTPPLGLHSDDEGDDWLHGGGDAADDDRRSTGDNRISSTF